MRFRLTSLIVVTSLWLVACEQDSVTLRVAAPDLPVDYEIAADLASMLDESAPVRLALSSSAMTESAALDALIAGEADIALVSNAMPFREGIATVVPLYPTVLHVAYHQGRDASSSTSLLTGANVYAGAEGTASRGMFERIASHLRLAEGDFQYVTDFETQADVVVLFTPVSPVRVAEYPELRLHSFGDPADVGQGSVVDAATLLNPYLRPFVIPAGTYGDATPGPVLTLAVDKILVAREDLEASVVYDLVRAILRSRPALAARYPGHFEHLADDFDVTRSTFVVHPGTQAYLQREAPTIYERYSGVAEVGVTLMIALASAIVATVRILQRRRKNRIDEFYSRAIGIRNSITGESSAEDRRAAIARIRELQNEAFEQLVDERLAADESFQIFITLSNDVLRLLEGTAT
jgi:TRAP-type uncharacterized transport system substrate-binding protein